MTYFNCKNFFVKIILIFILSYLSSNNLFSQIKKIGVPEVINYQKNKYKAGRQTWAITQQNNGMLYFANNSGLLQFDGSFWNLYPVPNNSVVRSIAVDTLNNIYCGASAEFGVFSPDKYGKLSYTSLSAGLPEHDRVFDEVWKTYVTKYGVYFQAYNALFLYKDKQLLTLFTGEELGFSFYVNDTLFVRNVERNKMLAFSGTQQSEKTIKNWNPKERLWQLLTYSHDGYLVVTDKKIYLLEGSELEYWNVPVNKTLSDNRIFSVEKLNDKTYAFGTVLNGVYIVNKEGEVLQHINRKRGLKNNTVLSLFSDQQKRLWLGLDNGISEIRINSPFTFFNEGDNLMGTGYAARIFNNKLYFGTNQGLWFKKQNDNSLNFSLIEELKGQVWGLYEVINKLYCCHDEGIFQINKDNTIRQVSSVQGAWNIIPVPGKKDYFVSGVYDGLIVLKKDETGKLRFLHRIKGFDFSSRFIEFDSDTSLWISHGYKGVYHLKIDNNLQKVKTIKFYNSKKGLPNNYGNTLFRLHGRIAVSTESGIYDYDKKTNAFKKSAYFNKLFKGINAFVPLEDETGDIWFVHDAKFSVLRKNRDGKYKLYTNLFNKFKSTLVDGFEFFYVPDKKNIFVGLENGFLHFNRDFKNQKYEFKTFIREVNFSNAFDTLYFDLGLVGNKLNELQFNYKGNSVRFVFSAPFFEGKEHVSYSFFLQNFDEKWSDWGQIQSKEYTALPPGKYSFKVKARNIYGIETKPVSFSYEILPPWYQSIYAYMVYFIFSLILIFVLANYISKRLEAEKIKIEKKQQEEMRLREKAFEEQNKEAERRIIKLKNEKLTLDIERKNVEFDLKKKELASIALQITHKNEILNEVKDSLLGITDKVNAEAKKHIKKLVRSIETEAKIDEDWEQFKRHFEQVHGEFFSRLRKKYPDLTPKDLKLCAYLRINLSTKEIAPLMNISVRGVEISRYRLRKKLNLDSNQNLIDFMMQV